MGKLKRKAPSSGSSRGGTTRYLPCPVCTASVPAFRINEHIDICAAGSAAPPKRAAATGVAGDGRAHQRCGGSIEPYTLEQQRAVGTSAARQSPVVGSAEPNPLAEVPPSAQPPTPEAHRDALSHSQPAQVLLAPRHALPARFGDSVTAGPAPMSLAVAALAASEGQSLAASAAATDEAHAESTPIPAAPSPAAAEIIQPGSPPATPVILAAPAPQKPMSPLLSRVPPLAFLRRTDGRKVALTDEQLTEHAPCELVRGCLPPVLASRLLQVMLRDAAGWVQPVWHIFGQRHLAPRKSAYFELSDAQGLKDVMDDDSAADASVNMDQRGVPDCLRQAAAIIDGHVNRLAKGSTRPLDDLDRCAHRTANAIDQLLQIAAAGMELVKHGRQGWQASYVMANLYRDGQDTSGAHADRLTLLGTRPIIASVSLGAARLFRVRRAVAASDKVVPTASSRKQKVRRAQPSVDITLPHNSLLIMWPPCQEAWKHEVPRVANVAPHPTADVSRVNLTFRRLKPHFEKTVPKCKCGKRAILKAAYPKGEDSQLGVRELSTTQRYFFACDNTLGAPCNFYCRFDDSSV